MVLRSPNSWSNCNLEMLCFEERGKTGLHDGGKRLGAKMRTNNKLNPHMASTPRFEPGQNWWEASALITVPPLPSLKKTNLQSATKWVETLRPKLGFFTFYWLQKEEIASPILYMQCCTDVRAPHRKHQTPQLRMEGTGEGCGFFCSLKLPYLSTMPRPFYRRL